MLRQRHQLRFRSGWFWVLLLAALNALAIPIEDQSPLAAKQASKTAKVYRGAIGDSHIEMNLQIAGDELTGTYFYDRIKQEIKVKGNLDKQGGLQLTEYDPGGKPTGKFVCKRRIDDEVDSECTWSRPNGTGERMVWLNEQHLAFANGLRVTPKVISNRKSNLEVSYPQITGGPGPLAASVQTFNRQISERVNKAIADFAPEPAPARTSFDTNYNILFASNTLISVEMTEYSNSGGAHPNNRFWTLTYDLAANRELKLDDLFKPDADYKPAIAEYVSTDINRRADQIEKEDAQRDGREVKQRDEQLVSSDQLPEVEGFAITPKGLMIYFDFPHVMAFFDRTFVPYSVVAADLQPNVPGKP